MDVCHTCRKNTGWVGQKSQRHNTDRRDKVSDYGCHP